MVNLSGHAYPWDVIGDPVFTDRVAAHGLRDVTLAAAYHSTRAATPLHPSHQIIEASYAALYRPVRTKAWSGLTPHTPQWISGEDPFGEAATILRAAGLSVTAWIVLTHNTRLGTENPHLTVTNCFGERYPYALCPSHPEIREYAATLATEAIRDAPVDAVSLEACGQLGVAHLSHHDRTDGAWTREAARLLSICCCTACSATWQQRGLNPEKVRDSLCLAVHGEAQGQPAPLDPDVETQLLAVRRRATDTLRVDVLAAVRREQSGISVTLHASSDPWATGPSPGITPLALTEVDRLLVPAWPTSEATADTIRAAVALGVPVDAYVTVLGAAQADVVSHVRRVVAAGATGLGVYHLGLAARRGQGLIADIAGALA